MSDDVETIREALGFVPTGIIECHGDKCRMLNCASCYADPEPAPGRRCALEALTRLEQVEKERDQLVAYLGETAAAVENPYASREEIATLLRKSQRRFLGPAPLVVNGPAALSQPNDSVTGED